MAKKDLKEEQLLTQKLEMELYQCLVHADKENYQIAAEQDELTYKQRMLYLYTERKNFERMGLEFELSDEKPSCILRNKYQDIVDAYIPKEQQETVLELFDRYPLFAYTRYQVIARSKRFRRHYELNHIFWEFKNQEAPEDGANITAIMLKDAFKEQELFQIAKDIMDGKDFGGSPTWQLFKLSKGMVMSGNQNLLHMLIELVKDRKVKEDFRQEICQAIAIGPVEAMLLLFQTLVENKMAKFRSVRRCVAAWTGLYDKKTYEQITDDVIQEIWRALSEIEYREKLLLSTNPREFYLGLWAVGCYSVENAMEIGIKCMESGTYETKLAVAYYAMSIEQRQFSTQLFEIAIAQSKDTEEDKKILAAIFRTYLRLVDGGFSTGDEIEVLQNGNMRSGVEKEMLPKQELLPYEKYFERKEQARVHFGLLETFYKTLPKKKQSYDLQELPIGRCMLSQGEVVTRMLLIAHVLQDEDMKDIVCPLTSVVDSDFRCACFEMCCAIPKTETQRKTIIKALSGKMSEDIMREAEHLLMEDFDRDNRVYRTLEFTDEELKEIEKVVSRPFLREWLYMDK